MVSGFIIAFPRRRQHGIHKVDMADYELALSAKELGIKEELAHGKRVPQAQRAIQISEIRVYITGDTGSSVPGS